MIGLSFSIGVPVLLLLVWLLFRGRGYKRTPLNAPPGADWQRTSESFTDLRSREVLDVWFCAGTGERAYVRRRGGSA